MYAYTSRNLLRCQATLFRGGARDVLIRPSHHPVTFRTFANKSDQFTLPEDKLTISFTTSQGPGGQNVNKVNTMAEVSLFCQTVCVAFSCLECHVSRRFDFMCQVLTGWGLQKFGSVSLLNREAE